MDEKFLKIKKDIKLQIKMIRESQVGQTLRKKNPKTSETKDREKILKATRIKRSIIYKETKTNISRLLVRNCASQKTRGALLY